MKKFLVATDNGVSIEGYATIVSDTEAFAKKLYTYLHNVVNPRQIIIICKHDL